MDQIDAVADKGYFKIEDIAACEVAGIVPFVPKPQRGSAVSSGFFVKDDFHYDTESDVYTCPGNQSLKRRGQRKIRNTGLIDYANPAACNKAMFLDHQSISRHTYS